MRRRAVLAAAATACLALPAAARAGALVEIAVPDRGGQIPQKWLPGYASPPRAKVLLPDGYDPARAYPLLILLAGLGNTYTYWSDPNQGAVEQVATHFPGIIVMPEGGSGWYADWWNDGRRGGPDWESYILDEVLPQVLDRYRVRPERRWHALAGVSMGGLGTAYLGSRLPGFFGSIAIISGLTDDHLLPGEGWVQSGIPQAQAGEPFAPDAVLGPPDGFYSLGHEPQRLAANLQHTRVFMRTGDGRQSVPDGLPNPANAVPDMPFEAALIRPASDKYAAALRAAGVDLDYAVHEGWHDWANFRRELREAIAWGLFEPVVEDASSWVADTVADHGRFWTVGYRFDRFPDRVVRMRRSDGRLSVSAAGSPVTLDLGAGCRVHVPTPSTVDLPRATCGVAHARGRLLKRATRTVLARRAAIARVACDRACTLTVVARIAGRATSTRTVRLAAAGHRTVRVPLDARGRRALKAGHRLTLKVTARAT